MEPPGDLSASEAKLFREIIASNHPDHFVHSDAYLLASYCQAIAASRRTAKQMIKDPKVVVVWERATRMQAQLATKLRLSPSSRMDAQTAFRKSRKHNPSAYDQMGNDDD